MLAAGRRPVGRQNIDQLETFSLFAELAIGLAGFTGVAAAFGGRDRVYSSADKIRIEGILLLAGSVLVGSLCVLTLTGAGLSAPATFGWASLVAAALQFPNFFTGFSRGYVLVKSPESSTSGRIYAQAMVLIGGCLGLYAGNIIVWREAWPLFAAFSLQLSWALYLFGRFLTHRN